MNIAHITTYPPKGQKHSNKGGVASYTKNLVNATPYNSNDHVYVLCDMINGAYESYEEQGATVIRCFNKSPFFIAQLKRELDKVNPDVVHIQQELNLYGNVITAYLLQWLLFFSRKYSPIITFHGVVNPKKVDKHFVKENNAALPVWLVKLAFKIIYKPLTVWTKQIIVHEFLFKTILVNEYRVPDHKITVIPHGIEALATVGRQKACKKLNLNPTRNLVLFVGFLTGYKGLDLLIEGFALYARSNQQAFLVIGAGKHPKLAGNLKYEQEYARLERKAAELIPEGQYRWNGFIAESELTDYYSACDVSVYPYTIALSSSGPMAFAIGFEKPFLVSDAFEDVFKNETQLIFKRNPQKFSQKLNSFFKNSQVYQAISKRLKGERLWGKVGQNTYQLYREAQ